MENYQKIHNVSNNKITEQPLSAQEYDKLLQDIEFDAKRKAEAQAKAEAKATAKASALAKLAALGLTPEEIAAL